MGGEGRKQHQQYPKKRKKEAEVKRQNNFTCGIPTLKCNDLLQMVTSGSVQEQINVHPLISSEQV